MRVKNFGLSWSFLHRFQDKCCFFSEFQDGCQKWQKKVFQQEVPDDSVYTMGIKKFVEIKLPCTIFEINAFYAAVQDVH